jgi:hypothetical protein
MGDELLQLVADPLRGKLSVQPIVIVTDLARLYALESALAEGFDQAVWIDADVLVIDPSRLCLPVGGALFGREVWIQVGSKDDEKRLRVYRKIHNAFMAFLADDPVLPFYRYSAERILERYEGPMVAQLVGPKLLTLLHNAIGFDVVEEAGMLSPAVALDLLDGGGRALDRFVAESRVPPAAINLCGSSITAGDLDDEQMIQIIELLLSHPVFEPDFF